MKKKSLILLLIISTVVIIQIQYQIFPTYVTDDSDNNNGDYSYVKQSTRKIAYTPHPNGSINITHNADFSKYNFNLGGDGIYYLTEFSILNSTVEPIHIENTTASFIISYCSLDSADWNHDVISLTNVTNGRIEHCTIKNGFNGIKLSSNCTNIVIDNNIIINNSELGIGHYDSEYNFITNNDISNSGCNNTSPVGIGASIKDAVQQTGGQGVYLDPSKFVVISGNSIHHNKHDGIHVVNSTRISIYDNCIYNNGPSECPVSPTIEGPISYKIQQTGGQGCYLDPSHNNTIYHNIFFENSEYGVYIQEGKNNTITFNDFIGNNGVTSQAYDNNTDFAYNNTFSNNYWSEYTGDGTQPYDIDGKANNTDSSPRNNILGKTCTSIPTTTPTTIFTTTTTTTTITTTTTTDGGGAAGFSFTVIMLVLLTITLIVRKNPRFRREK